MPPTSPCTTPCIQLHSLFFPFEDHTCLIPQLSAPTTGPTTQRSAPTTSLTTTIRPRSRRTDTGFTSLHSGLDSFLSPPPHAALRQTDPCTRNVIPSHCDLLPSTAANDVSAVPNHKCSHHTVKRVLQSTTGPDEGCVTTTDTIAVMALRKTAREANYGLPVEAA